MVYRSLALGLLAGGLLLCGARSEIKAAEVDSDVPLQNAVYESSQDGAEVAPVQYWRYRHGFYRPYYRSHLHYRPWAYRYPQRYYGPAPWYGRGYRTYYPYYGPGVYFGFRF